MAIRVFRLPYLICCDTCSQEWFGAQGEAIARQHARKSGHQVRINVLMRETLNEAEPGTIPEYEVPVGRTERERIIGREASIARLAAIYGEAP